MITPPFPDSELLSFLRPEQISTRPDDLTKYGRDWLDLFEPNASAVIFPKSINEVQQLVYWARKHHVSLIPSGGRTGLSGGATALRGEIIVSFEKMNQILNFNKATHCVTCQPGVITEQIQEYAKALGLYYPIDFAARGSSHIGGNIATNAGGIKVLRYGNTRNWVEGLKVITGEGELLELNKGLRKNATGYDFRHLFIGSEGTLGFIVEATLKLTNPPPATSTLLIATSSAENIMPIFASFKKDTQLHAFEFFSRLALKQVESLGLHMPLKIEAPYYLIIEVENKTPEDEESILNVFEQVQNEGLIIDGLMNQSTDQARSFWALRENISEACSRHHPYKNDISVTIDKIPLLVEELSLVLNDNYPTFTVIWYGHIGDGNLHINILRPQDISNQQFVQLCEKVDKLVFTVIKKMDGSISAEHGVGIIKKHFLNFTRSQSEIILMKKLKHIFDPDNILNPGKIFDP